MYHCVWEKLKETAKTAAAATKRTTTNKAKWWAEAKIRAAIRQDREKMKKVNKEVTFIVLKKHEINALKWKNRTKATDGMQYYWVKRGDKTKQKYGRHIMNTFSWVQEDMTTNTALESCWTRSGGKELVTLNTSTTGHHHHNRGQNADASNWWVCTSPTRCLRTITSRICTRRSRSTQQIAKYTYPSLEETSMQNWDLDTEQNVLMLAGTHSTKETKEVIGWNIGSCYRITQHLTLCTERHLRNKRPSYLQKATKNKPTTY